MTEAFKTWVQDLQSKTPYHYCGPDDAEHLIRAFVAEVRSRKHSGTPLYALGEALEEVVSELLGE